MIRWIDRAAWILILCGMGYLAYHLVIWTCKTIDPVWLAEKVGWI